MKIAIDARFITHPQPGGFKTYTTNLLAALAQIDRHNEYLLYVDRDPGSACMSDAPNFSYRVVPGAVPLIGMPLREQFSLRRAIARDRPDVTHFLCNTAPIAVRGAHVITLHDTIQLESSGATAQGVGAWKRRAITEYSKQAVLRSINHAARVVTVSEYVRREIHKLLGVPLARIKVVQQAPNPLFTAGTPDMRRAWAEELATNLGVPARFLLGVGYEPRKNIPLLIRAFARIAPTCPDIHLVLVCADVENRVDFQRLAESLGLAERVLVLGRVTLDCLVRLYNLAELFVFPSAREGYGLPPLEAMACGTPTIAMKRSSIPEVVKDAAVLVDSDDSSDWANAVARLLGDPDQMTELRRRGFRRVAELSWLRCAEDTLSVYRDVVASTSSAASSEARWRSSRFSPVRKGNRHALHNDHSNHQSP